MSLSRRRFLSQSALLAFSPLARGNPLPVKGRVVVIGGGYAGSTACKYLHLTAPSLKVTLVEPRLHYTACPGSNAVIAGFATMDQLEHNYQRLTARYNFRHLRETAVSIDGPGHRVVMESGRQLEYDRLIVAPGVDFLWDSLPGYSRKLSETLPHAWKAGSQTQLLAKQFQTLAPGSNVIITVPRAPFRCPPGPYERASLMAAYSRKHNLRLKIRILDANDSFSKQALFEKAWHEFYPGSIEWLPGRETGQLESLQAGKNTVHTEFDQFSADLINHIPPHRAAAIARRNNLTDATGWCPVDPVSFESTQQPDIHVIGDAALLAPMPKSAFSANTQAKACAVAVASLLADSEPPAQPLINTCYSLLDENHAISIASVYGYHQGRLLTRSSGVTPENGDMEREARAAYGWYRNIHNDVFE